MDADPQDTINKSFSAFAVWLETQSEFEGLTKWLDRWDVISFTQCWNDGSCGFGGMATASPVRTPTVVFRSGNIHVVFISNRFAYTIDSRYSQDFVDDLHKFRVKGKFEAVVYGASAASKNCN